MNAVALPPDPRLLTPDSPVLLALETATDVCSVALLSIEGGGERVVGVGEVLRPRQHAAALVPLVRDVLAQAEVGVGDLAAVAVSAGPGSYTGLRIGASTAKGLAWVAGAVLVAVPSLEALAFGAQDVVREGDLLVAAFRSRRGEVYAAAFARGAEGLRTVAPAAALALDALAGWLPEHAGTCWTVGEAGALVAEHLPGPCRVSDTRVLDPARLRPAAAHVGALGAARLASGETVDVADFEPEYLNAFVAKRGGSIFERLPK